MLNIVDFPPSEYTIASPTFPSISTWHLELSSRCALACSKCPRVHLDSNEFTFLDFERFESFFRNSQAQGNRWELVHLCGNHGDPIYHPRLLDFIKLFKSYGVVVQLTTNGSHRSKEWWSEIVNSLTSGDCITFSVDGLADTVGLYRVGADWDSIYQAMTIVGASKVESIWKYIVFRHNEGQIEQARTLAAKLHIKSFILVKSSAWETPLDPMLPSWEFVESSKRDALQEKLREIQRVRPQAAVGPFNRSLITPDVEEVYQNLKVQSESVERVYPRCLSEHHYLSAEGYYSPCCWMSVAHFKSENPFRSAEFQYPKSFSRVQESVAQLRLLERIRSAEFTACRTHCHKPCEQYHGHDFVELEEEK